jgi:hypothetical protein
MDKVDRKYSIMTKKRSTEELIELVGLATQGKILINWMIDIREVAQEDGIGFLRAIYLPLAMYTKSDWHRFTRDMPKTMFGHVVPGINTGTGYPCCDSLEGLTDEDDAIFRMLLKVKILSEE